MKERKKRENHDLALAKVRDRLAKEPQYEPYWQNIGSGRKLGLRFRPCSEVGSWVAKWTSTDKLESGTRPKILQTVLGRTDKMSHQDALQEATKWWQKKEGGFSKSGTIKSVCEEYVANQRSEKGERAAYFSQKRFALLVDDKPIGSVLLDKLTTRDLERWRDGLVTEQRKKNSANRDLRSLKAALNFAFQRGMCPSDAAWRRVKPLKGAGARDGQRTAYLTPEQRRKLIEKADKDTADFIRALLDSAARPNEIQAARVSDFYPLQKTLRLVSLKGQGEEHVRYVPLTTAAVEFFTRLTKSKTPKAPLVTCERLPWARHLWASGIRAAQVAANKGIKQPKDRLPLDVVAYTMRHCAITDMLRAGVDVSSVGKIAGTSITMINSHYAKFVQTDVREKLASITAF